MINRKKIKSLLKEYFSDNINNHSEIIDIIDGIKIRKVNSNFLSKKYPVWDNYLGSHHYGKKSFYIPENEIWVSDKVSNYELDSIIQHELIERSIMKVLQKYNNMTPEESWEIGHNTSKNLGF